MQTSVRILRKIFLAVSCVVLAVSSCLKEEVVITGISLDRPTLNLQLGETAKLNATVLPSSAVEIPIVWSSSNTEVVKVNHGSVTAAGLGKATVIAASSSSGGVTATCEVTVSDNVAGISLEPRELEIYEGNTEVIRATLKTSDSASKEVQWTSSADSLVEVSDGRIFAKLAPASGQPVKIEATVNDDGQNFTDSCMVTVKCHVSSIILNKWEVKMQEGDSTEIEVTVLPERATVRDLDFTVSDPRVISFNQTTRIIKALKASPEPAYITVTSRDTVSAGSLPEVRCKVNVVKSVEGISIVRGGDAVNTLLLSKSGGADTLSVKFLPDEGVTNKKVNWSSSNENVARIKELGENSVAINPVGVGYTTIIATSEDGGKTASCLLRVVVPLTRVAIGEDFPKEIYEGERPKHLRVKYEPEDATVDSVSWRSSAPESASVSSDGTLTAILASPVPVEIEVTAKGFTGDGSVALYSAKCSTTVKCHPTSVKLNTKSEIIKVGGNLQLSADVEPLRANERGLTWSSSNSSVATVDSNGKVEAKAVSDKPVYIVAETVDGNLKDSCEVRVVQNVSGIEIWRGDVKVDSVSVVKGNTASFACKLSPDDATDKSVVWESTNKDVATVDGSGNMTAVGGGYTMLIVKSLDGARTAWCKVRVIVPMTGFSFDKTLSMYEGEQASINVSYNPPDATDTNLIWTSTNNDEVVVIDGRIVALKAGSESVTIKAQTPDGSKTQSCSVTVKCHVEAVHLSHKSLSIPAGSEFDLSATVCPDRATDKGIKWSSDEPTVATVDTNGKITAIKDGTATITATSLENESISDCCILTVANSGTIPIKPKSVTLNKTSLSLKVGEKATLEATVSPADASDKSVSFSSNNEAVAGVDPNKGVVSAKRAGSAVITATTKNGKTATCTVTVSQEPVGPVYVTSVSLSATTKTVNIGGSLQITATVLPANATEKSLVWESNNTAVATVDTNGKVTGRSVGSAKITATSKNGKSGSIEIKVEKAYVPVTGIKIGVDPNDPRYDKGKVSLYVGEDFQLNVVISPSNATNKDVTWEVSGGHVKVSDGKLTAAACMSPNALDVVSVRSVDDPSLKRSVSVNVKARKATGVTLNRSAFSMTVGGSEKLHPVFAPVNTTDQSGNWESDNTEMVSVGQDGTVTANAPGQAKITFTSTDGGFKGYCYITVSSSPVVDPGRIQGVGFDDLNGE